jgi:hypothetical protein
MKEESFMQIHKKNGNLHINLDGQFTPDIAARLTITIAKMYQGKGNIFIHTDKITRITPDSRYAFTNLLGMSGLPQDNVYLTGEKGLEICHDTGKVIIRKKAKHSHGGCGRCKNCSCNKRKAA